MLDHPARLVTRRPPKRRENTMQRKILSLSVTTDDFEVAAEFIERFKSFVESAEASEDENSNVSFSMVDAPLVYDAMPQAVKVQESAESIARRQEWDTANSRFAPDAPDPRDHP